MRRIEDKYERAKRRIEAMQGFYSHLTAYIVINAILILGYPFFIGRSDWYGKADPELVHWLDLNILITPVIWGIALLIHYLCVFGFARKLIGKWEQRQITKYLEREE